MKEKLVNAMASVLVKEGISFEAFMKGTPSGFWAKVSAITGQKKSAAGMYWSKYKAKGLSAMLEARFSESVECESQDAHNQLGEQMPLSDERVSCETHIAPDQGEALSPECDAHAAHNIETPSNNEPDESVEYDAHILWSDIDKRMRAIAREVTENMLNEMNVRHEQHMMNVSREITGEDLPPEPEYLKGKKGRRQNRDYERLTVGINKNLARLFKADMAHMKVSSASRMMDIILWRYYGRPELAFKDDDNK